MRLGDGEPLLYGGGEGFGGLDGGRRQATRLGACGLAMFGLGAVLMVNSLGAVGPTELGLLSNDITSYVETGFTYKAGLHWIGLGKSFITFPSTQNTIMFTDRKDLSADAPPIATRTGEDHADPDSGGQPISICVSLQYLLPHGDHLGKIYSSFGSAYHERYTLIARNTISNVAQTFSPNEFWTKRTDVADEMFEACKVALQKQGMVTVTRLQLLRIDFPAKYEEMITQIQLQVQQKSTKEYQQKVTATLKDLDVMQATISAKCDVIQADAERMSLEIRNSATASGYVLSQAAKTNATRHVASALELTSEETVQYLKLKAIKTHPSRHTVVGLQDPFGEPKPPPSTDDV